MFSADASSRKGVTFPTNVYQISYFDETTCRLLVTEKVPGTPLARSPAMFLSASLSTTPSRGNVTVLHDDANGLLHAERVFLERGVAVDGAVEGEAQAIIRGRGGKHFDLVIDFFNTFNVLYRVFGIRLERRPDHLPEPGLLAECWAREAVRPRTTSRTCPGLALIVSWLVRSCRGEVCPRNP